MRKKALIAGGLSSFEGPWVSLEEGTWLVEPPSSGGAVHLEIFGKKAFDLFEQYVFKGPAKIRAIVIHSEEEIHLDVKQVKRA